MDENIFHLLSHWKNIFFWLQISLSCLEKVLAVALSVEDLF